MTPAQTQQIADMLRQGFSVGDMAEALKLPFAEIEQVVGGMTTQNPMGETADSTVLAQVEMLLNQLKEKERQIQADRQRFEEERQAEAARLEAERLSLAEKMKLLPSHEERYEDFTRRQHQERMTERYNHVLDEVIYNSTKARWKGIEVDALLERAETLRDKLVKFCDANRIDERRLTMYNGLTYLLDVVRKMQREQTTGFLASSSVYFNFKEETKARFIGYKITDFGQESLLTTTDPFIAGNLLDD